MHRSGLSDNKLTDRVRGFLAGPPRYSTGMFHLDFYFFVFLAAVVFFGAGFLTTLPFLGVAFFGVEIFFGAGAFFGVAVFFVAGLAFFAVDFFTGDFFGDFTPLTVTGFVVAFFAVGFLTAVFFAAGFFGEVAFFGAAFLASVSFFANLKEPL